MLVSFRHGGSKTVNACAFFWVCLVKPLRGGAPGSLSAALLKGFFWASNHQKTPRAAGRTSFSFADMDPGNRFLLGGSGVLALSGRGELPFPKRRLAQIDWFLRGPPQAHCGGPPRRHLMGMGPVMSRSNALEKNKGADFAARPPVGGGEPFFGGPKMLLCAAIHGDWGVLLSVVGRGHSFVA